jgi:hypothetical protein
VSPRKAVAAPKSGAASIVAPLREDEVTSEQVFAAFAELDELSPDAVRAELSDWLGPSSDPEALDDATRRAHGMAPRPLHLRTLAVVKDADVLDLGSIAEEQLRITGKAWDGQDLEAFERLDGEVEGSFAGSLAQRVLADASDAANAPLFDVVVHDGNTGIVFHAGTTRVAAMIADGRVEVRDAPLRAALEASLSPAASDVIETAETPTIEDEAPVPAKKTAKKRAAARTPAKKTTATAKRAPAKKATAKRTSSKK